MWHATWTHSLGDACIVESLRTRFRIHRHDDDDSSADRKLIACMFYTFNASFGHMHARAPVSSSSPRREQRRPMVCRDIGAFYSTTGCVDVKMMKKKMMHMQCTQKKMHVARCISCCKCMCMSTSPSSLSDVFVYMSRDVRVLNIIVVRTRVSCAFACIYRFVVICRWNKLINGRQNMRIYRYVYFAYQRSNNSPRVCLCLVSLCSLLIIFCVCRCIF